MKKRILSFALCAALCIGLLTGYAAPAYAAEFLSTWDEFGKNNIAWHNNRAFVVNNKNELWEFVFPSEDYDGTPEAASSKKIMDGVKEVVAFLGGVLILNTKDEISVYRYHARNNPAWFFTELDIKNVASLVPWAGGISFLYIDNNRALYLTEVVTDSMGFFTQTQSPTKIDDNVHSAANMCYIKNDASLWGFFWGTGNALETKKLLDNVSCLTSRAGPTNATYFAITNDGALWAWGNTKYGETGIGNNSPNYRRSVGAPGSIMGGAVSHVITQPTKVIDGVARVIPEYNLTHVVTKDGRVLTWGGEDMDINPNTVNPQTKSENQWLASNTFTLAGTVYYHSFNRFEVAQNGNGTLKLYYMGYTFTPNMILLTENTSFIPTTPANDQPSSWAVDAVRAGIVAEIVHPSLRSNYNQPATRAEFCSLAVALYENVKGEITGRSTFSDTNDVNVQKAAFIGVVGGVGNNRFDPNAQLTREQAAAMLARLADAVGEPFPKQAATFADNSAISSWALEAVGQAQAAGIMGGVGDNRFAPKDPYTREQSIVTIMRLFDTVK